MKPARRVAVITHRRPGETAPVLRELIDVARTRGVRLVLAGEERDKHGLETDEVTEFVASLPREVDLCLALGGDGTILTALRTYAGTDVPVFGINFGEVGFLSTVERDLALPGIHMALDGVYGVMSLPAIELMGSSGNRWLAINDVSLHRQPGKRVADLEYGVTREMVGRVRCDGLVVATPAGSTGYNLANGGPVMAWGVEGIVVSFIAPHSLTARALVVAPSDPLEVINRSQDEAVEVTVDGRPVGELMPGEVVQARLLRGQGVLAQVEHASFYARLRDKFGLLANARF